MVLDAQGRSWVGRVLHIKPMQRLDGVIIGHPVVKLKGLNITGGYADWYLCDKLNEEQRGQNDASHKYCPQGEGGGLRVSDGCEAVLEKCNIYLNTAQHGGGLYVDHNSKASLIDSNVYRNLPPPTGAVGAGLAISGPNAFADITRCNIFSNAGHLRGISRANDFFDFFPSKGGGMWVGKGAVATLIESNIFDNLADKGGGLYLETGAGPYDATLTNTSFYDNQAQEVSCQLYPLP